MILTSVLQAMGLFAATNIDDIIVLSLFFARGAGQRGTTARILAGQYLGFAGILGAAVLVTIGAGAFLPSAAIPYFGLIPLGLGLWAAWQAWRGDDDDDDDEARLPARRSACGQSQASPLPTAATTSASTPLSSSAWNLSQ
jgi:cadmium resistance protein CadD (predicted permease)